jgi:hypothetical protein
MLSKNDIETFFNWIGVRYTIRESKNQEQGWNKGAKEHGIWYLVTFKRMGKSISFSFGDSINNRKFGGIPTIDSILESALYDRNHPGSLYDFCGDMGYDANSTEGRRIYKAVLTNFKKLNSFFSEEELDQLESDEPLPVAPETEDMVTGYDRSLEEKVNARLLGYESVSPIIEDDLKLLEVARGARQAMAAMAARDKELELKYGKVKKEEPEERPYGYWIDKSGKATPVDVMNHYNTSCDLGFKGSDDCLDAGYVRVVFEPSHEEQDILYYETGENNSLTSRQKSIIKQLSQKYNTILKRDFGTGGGLKFEGAMDDYANKRLAQLDKAAGKRVEPDEETRPYGYWIDKDGKATSVIQTGNKGTHAGVARKLGFSDEYDCMKAGYLRVVFDTRGGNIMYCQAYPGRGFNITPKQRSTITEIAQKYNMELQRA